MGGFLGSPDKIGHSSASQDPYEMDTCEPGGPCEPGVMGTPWIHRYGFDNFENNDVGTQYLAALHFATALITGGELNLQPGWWGERIYTVIMMLLSFILCSSILAQVVAFVEKMGHDKTQFHEKMVT